MQTYINYEFRAVDSQLQIEGDSRPIDKLIATGVLSIFFQTMNFEDI